MSAINLNNYEAYLLDFSEGKLSEETQVELEMFLMQHSALGIDLNELALVPLDSEKISFNPKQNLKKTYSDLISENQFIAYIENITDEADKSHIEKSCALNPQLQAELDLYKHTIYQADRSIVFSNKASLKRKPKVIWLNLNASQFAAAACVVIILSAWFFWPVSNNVEATIQLAKNDPLNSSRPTHLSVLNKTPKSAVNKTVSCDNLPLNAVANAAKKPNQKTQPKIINTSSNQTVKTSVVENNIASTPIENSNHVLPETATTNQPQPSITATKKITNHIIEVISESQDELVAENAGKKKKGIWSVAGKALKNLNQLGVKSVNGEEENTKNNTAYALTLGGLSITHTSAANL